MKKFSFLVFFFGTLAWLFGCTRHGEAEPSYPDPLPRSEQLVSLDFFHMNWGWERARSNGWYRIDGNQDPWSSFNANRYCLLVRKN